MDITYVCVYFYVFVSVCQKPTLLAKIFSDRAFLPSWAPWASAEITPTPQAPSVFRVCWGCDSSSSCQGSTHIPGWIISSILEDRVSKTLQISLSAKAFYTCHYGSSINIFLLTFKHKINFKFIFDQKS